MDGSALSGSPGSILTRPSPESVKKLDQIIQNFLMKAATLILQSRLHLTPGRSRGSGGKTNKWFQIETDDGDIDGFREELLPYKLAKAFENQPPPLIIETYLDASRLSSSQSLVVVDEQGKRWDVLEALNSSETSYDDVPRGQQRNTEVILERWRIELKCTSTNRDELGEFGPNLPIMYKRGIIFFRSLFVTARTMPCWKFSQQALTKGTHPALEVKCRVLSAEPDMHSSYDPLRQPLFDGRDVVTEYMFSDLEVPVGRFYASVTYRNECNFRVDDSESLLSSRFMGVDENFFKPSISQRHHQGRSDSYEGAVGSLPSQRQGRRPTSREDQPQQTYGSLSTFHGKGAPGTSPISALKAVRAAGSDTSSPPGSSAASVTEQMDPTPPPHSLPIRGAAARPLRYLDGTATRRPSVSFQPFKAGSLSGSPRLNDQESSSPQSLPRPSALGVTGTSMPSKRSSLTAGMAASLRGPGGQPSPESIAGSPKPPSRYSSSFTHRRNRPSFGGQSKGGDDDAVSSGKQSLSSSVQPGSGLLTEAVGGQASSGSFATDDDNISEFLKALDSRKTLASFETRGTSAKGSTKGEGSTSAAQAAQARRTAAQLTKFHLMRESNNVLTDSMTSSIRMDRSSVSSRESRQLANVPGMVNPGAGVGGVSGASVSVSMASSSSPGGKPLSPHTPHTPAIPSRLSENSIIEYQEQRRGRRVGEVGRTEEEDEAEEGADEEEEDEDEGAPVGNAEKRGGSSGKGKATAAIDIPTSPRLLHTVGGGLGNAAKGFNRRASSVAQHRSIASGAAGTGAGAADVVPDDLENLGQRSLSLGADDREGPTRSTLLAMRSKTQSPEAALSPGKEGKGRDQDASADGGSLPSNEGASPSGLLGLRPRTPYRSRFQSQQGGVAGTSPSSRGAVSRGSFSGARYGGRGGAGAADMVDGADDEPLLFAMSELERPYRRSLEEREETIGAATSSAGATSSKAEKGSSGFEPRGTTRRGW